MLAKIDRQFCMCSFSFLGFVAPCSSSPCLNDGTCVPLENQMFDCLCSNGFVGSTCSEEGKILIYELFSYRHCYENTSKFVEEIGIYIMPLEKLLYVLTIHHMKVMKIM